VDGLTTLGVDVSGEVGPRPGVDAPPRSSLASRPVVKLLLQRSGAGLVTLLVVSFIVFWATQVLPGNAVTAILGQHATPDQVTRLTHQLHLDRSWPAQYWSWLTGLLSGDVGISLTTGRGVGALVGERLLNSTVLMVASGLIGTLIGALLGVYAGTQKGKPVDRVLSVLLLAVTALPEFVVAVALIVLLSTVVTHLLPAVSLIPPGEHAWNHPRLLVLPVTTLVIVIVPYLFRMMRATMIEALESDYAEFAHLRGVPSWRVALLHALPNVVAPTIQVVGLNLLYLAGGIVVVEYVFNFPGIGQGLVSAINDRDVPTVQLIVVVLAAFYVLVNTLTDLIALLATPRRRLAR
jgi:peptide/nickel transport system permease protein